MIKWTKLKTETELDDRCLEVQITESSLQANHVVGEMPGWFCLLLIPIDKVTQYLPSPAQI